MIQCDECKEWYVSPSEYIVIWSNETVTVNAEFIAGIMADA